MVLNFHKMFFNEFRLPLEMYLYLLIHLSKHILISYHIFMTLIM